MGCDIHVYIECYSKKSQLRADTCFVDTFFDNVNFGRNYTLFGFLAGVRSSEDPVVDPRGIPNQPELSWAASRDYYIKVVPDNEYVKMRDFSGQRIIKQSELEILKNDQYRKLFINSENMLVNPDWHTPTWLSVEELFLVRKNYLVHNIQYCSELSGKKRKELVSFISGKNEKDLMKYVFHPYEYAPLHAIISAMISLEKTDDDLKTRFVCWFDS